MPRNINGVYSLPAGNPVVPGTLIETTWANPTMADIGNEITNSLPRNGSAPMTGPLILSRDGILPKEATTVDQLTQFVTGNNSFLPAGAVQLFAMVQIPTGWLECDGAAISRTTYSQLFGILGTTYGVGNGVTTFNIPDLRGEFVRGFDNGRSVDPGRTIGSNQSAANAPHTHGITDPAHSHTQVAHNHTITDPGHIHSVTIPRAFGTATRDSSGADNITDGTFNTNSSVTGVIVNNATPPPVNLASTNISINSSGTEGRPRNVAMVYCIKAFGALQQDGLGTMAFQNKETVNITGGSGDFDLLRAKNAPVDPTDVVRLADLGGSVNTIASSDTQVLVVDNTDPDNPILRPQTNIPNGMVKLNASGTIPNSLLSPSGYSYEGTFDASPGVLPVGTFLDGSFYSIDVSGTLNLYHSNGIQSPTVCAIGTNIVYLIDSVTLPVPGWYYEPPPALSGATASQVTFVPSGTIVATNVQAAIEELDGQAITTASTLPFTPSGTIVATNVQTAIEELDGQVQDDARGMIPVGGLIDFAGSIVPVNYLALPLVATNINRTTYARLFAAIGTTWGAGDGSTTFGMPYLPADQTTVQANGNVGTITVGENLSHNHDATQRSSIAGAGAGFVTIGGTGVGPGGISLGNSGGAANLPAGVRYLKCVRYQ